MNGNVISNIVMTTLGDIYDIADLGYGQYRLANIGEAFIGINTGGFIDTLKIAMTFLTVILAILFVYILLRSRELGDQPSIISELVPPAPARGGAMQARWDEILRHMDSAKEAEWKFALIEADKLVDDVLRKAGFPGDMLGERLMNIQDGQLTTLDGLWEAHKIRNRLVHDTDYFLRYSEAKRAIEAYEQTLKELGGL